MRTTTWKKARSGLVALAVLAATGSAVGQDQLGSLTGMIGSPAGQIGDLVFSGDTFTTGSGDRLMMRLRTAQAVLCVGPDSHLTLTGTPDAVGVELDRGLVRLYYQALSPGQSFALRTPLGAMSLTGSVVWASHSPQRSETIFASEDTDATITAGAASFALASEQMVILTGDTAGDPQPIDMDTIRSWEQRLQLVDLTRSSLTRDHAQAMEQTISTLAFKEVLPTEREEITETAARLAEKDANQRVINKPGTTVVAAGQNQTTSRVPVFTAPPLASQSPVVIPDPGVFESQQITIGNNTIRPEFSYIEGALQSPDGQPASLFGIDALNPVFFVTEESVIPASNGRVVEPAGLAGASKAIRSPIGSGSQVVPLASLQRVPGSAGARALPTGVRLISRSPIRAGRTAGLTRRGH